MRNVVLFIIIQAARLWLGRRKWLRHGRRYCCTTCLVDSDKLEDNIFHFMMAHLYQIILNIEILTSLAQISISVLTPL